MIVNIFVKVENFNDIDRAILKVFQNVKETVIIGVKVLNLNEIKVKEKIMKIKIKNEITNHVVILIVMVNLNVEKVYFIIVLIINKKTINNITIIN